jgi:hypothetical protein
MNRIVVLAVAGLLAGVATTAQAQSATDSTHTMKRS